MSRPPGGSRWKRVAGCPGAPANLSRRSEQGSAAAETVILAPLLILLAVLLLVGGRLATASEEIGDAARTAVESAVVAPTASAAETQAAATARFEVSRDGIACTPYTFETNVTDFTAGGFVSVQLRCRVELVTLGIPGLAGSVSLSDGASAAIETYRDVG
jgi:hypothetical protein